MRVVALKAWSNGSISMEEKGVYDVNDEIAQDLIAQGLVADAATYFGGGGSGGGVLVVTDTDGTLDKTWQEIHDAMLVGGAVVRYSGDYYIGTIAAARYNNKNEEYTISANADGSFEPYSASSASGYPTRSE